MNTQQAYNNWAAQYDTNDNKTRDLEGRALQETLAAIPFERCLEIGCGTGKNTEWLLTRAETLTAVDLSEEMLAKAKLKITSSNTTFVRADIQEEWGFVHGLYDLVSFSLVLEHIENLEQIFEKAANALAPGGYVYVGELHPFKQYTGSKARFETTNETHIVNCFNHNISDFTNTAKLHGLQLTAINEYFDDGDRGTLPRILSLVFKKA